MTRRRLRMWLIILIVLVAIVYFGAPYARAMSLIVRVAGIGGPAQAIVSLPDSRVDIQPKHDGAHAPWRRASAALHAGQDLGARGPGHAGLQLQRHRRTAARVAGRRYRRERLPGDGAGAARSSAVPAVARGHRRDRRCRGMDGEAAAPGAGRPHRHHRRELRRGPVGRRGRTRPHPRPRQVRRLARRPWQHAARDGVPRDGRRAKGRGPRQPPSARLRRRGDSQQPRRPWCRTDRTGRSAARGH